MNVEAEAARAISRATKDHDGEMSPELMFYDRYDRPCWYREGPSRLGLIRATPYRLDSPFGRYLLSEPCSALLDLSLMEARKNPSAADVADLRKRRIEKAEIKDAAREGRRGWTT